MVRIKTTIDVPRGVVDEQVSPTGQAILLVNKPTTIVGNLAVTGSVNFTSGGAPSIMTLATSSLTLTHVVNAVTLVNAVSGAVNVFLPDAGEQDGTHLFVKKIDPSINIVSVYASGSQTIDGVNPQEIHDQYVTLHIVSYSDNWWIV